MAVCTCQAQAMQCTAANHVLAARSRHGCSRCRHSCISHDTSSVRALCTDSVLKLELLVLQGLALLLQAVDAGLRVHQLLLGALQLISQVICTVVGSRRLCCLGAEVSLQLGDRAGLQLQPLLQVLQSGGWWGGAHIVPMRCTCMTIVVCRTYLRAANGA